ncbi:MAG: hypothetical protein ACJ75J_13310 [Cytophagaceae bacterium]
MLAKAIKIATEAHASQKDKNGAPYILHVMRVGLRGKNDNEKICGILHDVVEDTDWTFEKLEKEGFSEEVIAALKCVTKTSEDEPYDDFIERVKKNKLAIAVKINDLEDNMDVRRIPQLTEKDMLRINKYLKAYRELIKL